MELTITQADLDEAREARACSDALARYTAGMDVADIAQGDLVWCEENLKDAVARIEAAAGVPLWACSGDGHGHGHGHGSGHGYGYGYGDGCGCGE